MSPKSFTEYDGWSRNGWRLDAFREHEIEDVKTNEHAGQWCEIAFNQGDPEEAFIVEYFPDEDSVSIVTGTKNRMPMSEKARAKALGVAIARLALHGPNYTKSDDNRKI